VPNSSELPWLGIVNSIIAIWGAGLSTFIYCAQRRRDRPKLKVKIHDPENDGNRAPVLQVSAVNVGHQDVRLEDASITLRNGEELVTNDLLDNKTDMLPCMLQEGGKFTARIAINELYHLLSKKGYKENEFVMLRGKLFDSTGKAHVGQCYRYLIKNWIAKSPKEMIEEPIQRNAST
jgi:hypothetical protein